jgi:peptidoglycan hydrolase CwlO-like protein
MYHWPLNEAPFVLLVLACVALIIIGSIVTALTTVRRAEFSRLQNEVKQLSMMQNDVQRLSKKIKALEADEELRLLREVNDLKRAVVHRPSEKKADSPRVVAENLKKI